MFRHMERFSHAGPGSSTGGLVSSRTRYLGLVDAERLAPDPQSTVAVAGEIDIATVTDLRARLLAQEGRVVVADLGGVTFMDSSGLAGLLDARAALADDGRDLELINRPPVVIRLLQVAGLTDHFGPVR
jgi:anti-anti-sigma factor